MLDGEVGISYFDFENMVVFPSLYLYLDLSNLFPGFVVA
jgi:hypothetical protein